MRQIILLVLPLFLLGCPAGKGVSRTSYVNKRPDIEAVAKIIRNYKEIDSVTTEHTIGSGQAITLTGLKDPDEIYSIFYKGGDNVSAVIMFTEDYKGRIKYIHYSRAINRSLLQEQLRKTYPIMLRIENDLIEIFDLKMIESGIKVYRTGISREFLESQQVAGGDATR